MSTDPESWRAWIGREEIVEDVLDPARAEALHATLGRTGPPPAAGDPLPPLWHWIYFWSIAAAAELGPDGHLALGRFLPPLDQPPLGLTRRMWAGSRFTFHRDPILGKPAKRRSVVENVACKDGRSGPLAFVTIRHHLSDGAGLCLEEEQDVVFRQPRAPGADASPPEPGPTRSDPPTAAWSRLVRPDPVMLFRYSALTFNGHRIHYDTDFARETDGYPGLVVHGPLLGLLMCHLAWDETGRQRPCGYWFRLSRPIFVPQSFTVAGRPSEHGQEARLWIETEDGARAAEGCLAFA